MEHVRRSLVTIAAGLCICAAGCFSRSKPSVVPGSLSAEESHAMMVERLADVARRAPDENMFVGDLLARTARSHLQRMSAATPKLDRWLRTYQLAKAELHQGNEAESIRLMNEAVELIRDRPQQVKRELLLQFYFDMAVAYLRWGETQNCCQQNAPGSCILPIRGEAIHQRQEGSQRGIEWLATMLKYTDEEMPMHLAGRWLLNLAYMTLGEYPEGVPTEYLIKGIGAVSSGAIKPWKNVASQSGVATFSLAGGAIADDFDNDGDADLVVSSWDPSESLRVFWNDGTGQFQDGTAESKLGSIVGGLNITQTDYNNDGLPDIFVLRGGWLAAAGQHPNSLLRNNGDGSFTDVTITAGLSDPPLPTQTAAWSDYDLDGDLDVYVGNESSEGFKASSQLFRNNGDGTFTDVASQAGVANQQMAKAVAWGDYDADRYPDLYVSNYRGPNRLYHNRGDGTFEDVAAQLDVAGPEASFPTWFWDVNNDGHLDLFVAAYSGGVAELAAFFLEKPFDRKATMPRLYIGSTDGFTDQAESFGLIQPTHPMGANFGDINNDGFDDFYLGTGWPEYHELMPNVLFQNVGGVSFQDISNASRVGHLQKGHAVAMADFDNDGDLDVFEQMGGFVPGDKFYDVLYENPGNDGNWLRVRLIGEQSNRPGIGSRIHLRIRDGNEVRSIFRYVNSGGSFGANPMEQHIGIGQAQEVLSLQVFWPATGKTDSFTDVQINQRVKVTEGASEYELLPF